MGEREGRGEREGKRKGARKTYMYLCTQLLSLDSQRDFLI